MRALITGVTGQGGACLAWLLLQKGYAVHGVKRRSSSFRIAGFDDIYEDSYVQKQTFQWHYRDLTDATNLIRIVQGRRPTSSRSVTMTSLSRDHGHPKACWHGLGAVHRAAREADRCAAGLLSAFRMKALGAASAAHMVNVFSSRIAHTRDIDYSALQGE